MIDFLVENWILVAFVAPAVWSMVNIIDAYFVHSVYGDAFDGAMISGLFQAIPWLLVLFGVIPFAYPGDTVLLLSVTAGACFAFAMFFYFRALFATNDTVLTQVLWNISILLVPFFAWAIFQERLETMHYIGIGFAFLGAILLIGDYRIRTREGFGIVFPSMVFSVILLSLSMVLSKVAYEDGAGQAFWNVYLCFNAGNVLASFLLFFFDKEKLVARSRRLWSLSKQYLLVFVIAESLQLFGMMASQRAIDLSPSVSFVAVIESLLPVFILVFSAIIVLFSKYLRREVIQQIYQEQFVAIPSKLLAIVVMAGGIYLVS